MTIRTLLAECAEIFFGPTGASELARRVKVSDRTMRRWLAGDTTPPAGIIHQLVDLSRERLSEIARLRTRLEAAAPARDRPKES